MRGEHAPLAEAPLGRQLPDFVGRAPSGPYRRLNPTTKAVIAFSMALLALGLRGWAAPLTVLAVVVALAIWLRIGRSLVPFALVTIPLVISILAVNTLAYPGAQDTIGQLGPFSPSWTGFVAAVQGTLRVVAFAMSVGLFALTTTTHDLVSDLERRGVGRRPIFVISGAIGTVPRMVERAREITDAQRARGLDTQGHIWSRIRGLVPLAGPLVLGALTEVEERTMALEARGFTAPGRRTVLRPLPDSVAQRVLRWLLFVGTIVILVASVLGALGWLP